MDCPQCGAEVPSDDAFCGKCGYAKRDHGPERLDQSRIRMHEEPEPAPQARASPVLFAATRTQAHRSWDAHGSGPRLPAKARLHRPRTLPPSAPPPPPPTSLASARSGALSHATKDYAWHSAPRLSRSRRAPSLLPKRLSTEAEHASGSRGKQSASEPEDPEPSHACPGSLRQCERVVSGHAKKEEGRSSGLAVLVLLCGGVARLSLSDGEWLARHQTDQMRVQRRVGRVIPPESKFCGKCGTPLTSVGAQAG